MTIRDRDVVELLRAEPELLAIADAVVETQRFRRRFRPWGAATVVATAAALFVIVLAAPWDRGRGTGLVIDRALAAVGSEGDVVHFTIRLEETKRKGTLQPVTTENFYDKQRGVLRVISRSGSKVLGDYTTTAANDEFRVFPGLLDGAAFYRQALAGDRAEVVGKGLWEGRPVYWLELKEDGIPGIFRIGVDRQSYRPVVFRFLGPNRRSGRYQIAVLGLDYVTTAEAGFGRTGPILVSGIVVGPDCRPLAGARVGVFISPDLSDAKEAVSAEVDSVRTGPDGRFRLRADPSKSPFPEALAQARKNNGGWLNFDLTARGKDVADGFGYWGFPRFEMNGRWWTNETDQPEKPTPITIKVSKGPAGSSC